MASHPTQQFYLVSDQAGPYQYYSRDGDPEWWRLWLSRFSPEVGLLGSVGSADVGSLHPQRPFSLFLSREFLGIAESDLRARYPDGRMRNVTPTGELVVFEVPPAQK